MPWRESTVRVFCSPAPTARMGQPCTPSCSVRNGFACDASRFCNSSTTSRSGFFHLDLDMRSIAVRPRLGRACCRVTLTFADATLAMPPLKPPPVMRGSTPAIFSKADCLPIAVPMLRNRLGGSSKSTTSQRSVWTLHDSMNARANDVFPEPGTPVIRASPSLASPVSATTASRLFNALNSASRPAKWYGTPRSVRSSGMGRLDNAKSPYTMRPTFRRYLSGSRIALLSKLGADRS